MWRIVCKCVCLLTACGLLLSAAGCSHGTVDRQKRLFDVGIVIDNNLTLENKELANGNIASDFLAIDGLRDQAIEDKINSRIQAVADEMHSGTYVPPYRGIAVKIRQHQDELKQHLVYMYNEFNSNNILSVYASCYTYYENDNPDDDLSYSYEVPLTFDLTTGDELTLQDLFAPGTDYIELINRQVDAYLMANGYDSGVENNDEYYSDEIALTAPFQSITPEQKFYVSSEGDLILILDFDTPFVYTTYPIHIFIDSRKLGDAYLPYRKADEPIYHFNTEHCRLMWGYAEKREQREIPIQSNVHFSGTYSYQEGTPEAVVKQAETLTFELEHLPFSVDDVCRETSDLFGDEKWTLYISTYTGIIATKCPDYFGFSRSDMVYGFSENDNPASLYRVYDAAYCFDRDGNPVEPSALFVRPEQMDSLLTRVMVHNLTTIDDDDEPMMDDVQAARKLVQKVRPRLNGAGVEAEQLHISFDISDEELEKLADGYLDETHNIYTLRNALSYLAYDDIGYENLVMFREVFR